MSDAWIRIPTFAAGVVALAVSVMAAAPSPASRPLAVPAQQLTVVELFQSQGCSSCPPANRNVMAIADQPGILTLSFQVTYWDTPGWTDTFGSPQFTQRQRDYAAGLHHDNVYTPQVVINGRKDGVGADPADLARLLAAGSKVTPGPAVSFVGATIKVAPGPAQRAPADVWLVRYDPRILQVPIARGENGGRTLPHRNVVRELVRVGAWSGAPITLNLPPAKKPGLRDAILVQAPRGGPILTGVRR